MVASDFAHVRFWVFDLDNTLYPPSAQLFSLMEPRMAEFISSAIGVTRGEAEKLRARYWQSHGTTLAGLMDCHDVDPEAFLEHVHDIDLSGLRPDPALSKSIAALPGHKIVYTNGSVGHAERVVAALDLTGAFDALFGIEHASYRPKPERFAFETIFEKGGINPAEAAMFEDDPRNLEAPHDMGLRTVLVRENPENMPHIHYHTRDLSAFLSHLVGVSDRGDASYL